MGAFGFGEGWIFCVLLCSLQPLVRLSVVFNMLLGAYCANRDLPPIGFCI